MVFLKNILMNFVKLLSDKALILLDCTIWGDMGIMDEWLV